MGYPGQNYDFLEAMRVGLGALQAAMQQAVEVKMQRERMREEYQERQELLKLREERMKEQERHNRELEKTAATNAAASATRATTAATVATTRQQEADTKAKRTDAEIQKWRTEAAKLGQNDLAEIKALNLQADRYVAEQPSLNPEFNGRSLTELQRELEKTDNHLSNLAGNPTIAALDQMAREKGEPGYPQLVSYSTHANKLRSEIQHKAAQRQSFFQTLEPRQQLNLQTYENAKLDLKGSEGPTGPTPKAPAPDAPASAGEAGGVVSGAPGPDALLDLTSRIQSAIDTSGGKLSQADKTKFESEVEAYKNSLGKSPEAVNKWKTARVQLQALLK